MAFEITGAVQDLQLRMFDYLIIQVAAVMVCDTVHQAMVIYSGMTTLIGITWIIKWPIPSVFLCNYELGESRSTRCHSLV